MYSVLLFFCKQKTAYEIRISDWSSDVCSSDLRLIFAFRPRPVRTACSTTYLFSTGSIPGMAASTSETWLFGSAPNAVEAPENSFDSEITWAWTRSEEHTSELQSLMRNSYAVFCMKKKNQNNPIHT